MAGQFPKPESDKRKVGCTGSHPVLISDQFPHSYDYDQHIRDGGGGVFIPSVELPPEVFGSQLGPRPQMTGLCVLIVLRSCYPILKQRQNDTLKDEESRELLEDDVLEILEGKIDANEVDELEDDFLQIADERELWISLRFSTCPHVSMFVLISG